MMQIIEIISFLDSFYDSFSDSFLDSFYDFFLWCSLKTILAPRENTEEK